MGGLYGIWQYNRVSFTVDFSFNVGYTNTNLNGRYWKVKGDTIYNYM